MNMTVVKKYMLYMGIDDIFSDCLYRNALCNSPGGIAFVTMVNNKDILGRRREMLLKAVLFFFNLMLSNYVEK